MGKLHGTLAKAGKVRKQTPKVAKKEKRRKIQGRAYRRVQALKRFAPLKLGQKKRGPNCQTVKPAAPAKK